MSSSTATSQTHYEVLGVSPEATLQEIKVKYRALVLKYHPDVNPSEDGAAQFVRIKEAFEILSVPTKRALYDEELRMVNAPTFRGEPWPTRKHRYARQSPPTSASYNRASNTTKDGKKIYDFEEWERMHYGRPSPSTFWPTGEKEEDLTDHQLYFKHRRERLAKGGQYPWSANIGSNNTRKFTTLILRYCL